MIYLFKKIVFNCKQATQLALKREERKLSIMESIRLSYHLFYCGPCRKFIKQSRLINRIGKELAQTIFNRPRFPLSEERKQSIQQQIDSLNRQ